jgi:hypothetical protein
MGNGQLMKSLIISLMIVLGTSWGHTEQIPKSTEFEEAVVRISTIVPHEPLRGRQVGIFINPRTFEAKGVPLKTIVARAFRVPPFQVLGRGLDDEMLYDIQAVIPSKATVDQIPDMLKHLLEERFRLTAHEEVKASDGAEVSVKDRQPWRETDLLMTCAHSHQRTLSTLFAS